ncbi:MAG: GNAT family N-acetyltransferase [Planctomycetota bacterium]
MTKSVLTEAKATDREVLELIARHREFCVAHTPPESVHAVAPDEVRDEDVRYWLARVDGRAIGCIGLRAIEPGHGEIKTLHVRPEARGSGVGARLVNGLLAIARDEGVSRVSLETGGSDGFAPARALYRRLGFAPCAAFGPYAGDPFSYCMTREI